MKENRTEIYFLPSGNIEEKKENRTVYLFSQIALVYHLLSQAT